MKTYWGLEV